MSQRQAYEDRIARDTPTSDQREILRLIQAGIDGIHEVGTCIAELRDVRGSKATIVVKQTPEASASRSTDLSLRPWSLAVRTFRSVGLHVLETTDQDDGGIAFDVMAGHVVCGLVDRIVRMDDYGEYSTGAAEHLLTLKPDPSILYDGAREPNRSDMHVVAVGRPPAGRVSGVALTSPGDRVRIVYPLIISEAPVLINDSTRQLRRYDRT